MMTQFDFKCSGFDFISEFHFLADDEYGELTLPPDYVYLQEDRRHSTKHTGNFKKIYLNNPFTDW